MRYITIDNKPSTQSVDKYIVYKVQNIWIIRVNFHINIPNYHTILIPTLTLMLTLVESLTLILTLNSNPNPCDVIS